MNTKKLGIILVTYNSIKHIGACVESIRRQDAYSSFVPTIIVLDNASTDGTVDFLYGDKGIQLIQNITNSGYARAMNQGIKIAWSQGCDHFLLLNPDVTLHPSFLTSLWPVTEYDSWGVCQGLLLESGDRTLINSAGNKLHYLGFGYIGDSHLPLLQIKKSWEEDFVPIAYASGACMLVSARALDHIGFFDERLFSYHEDLDLGWRMHLAGLKVLLATEAHAFHDYDEHRHSKKMYLMERNRYLVLLKNYHIKTLFFLLPLLGVCELFLLFSSARNGWFFSKIRSYWGILREMPGIYRARTSVQATRVKKDHDVLVFFTYKMSMPLPSLVRVGLKVYYSFLLKLVSW